MYKVLVFAGTSEGRAIAEYLNAHQIPSYICAATAYGESLLPAGQYLKVSGERLDEKQMEQLLLELGDVLVVDATHPYADLVTENIRRACEKTSHRYIRLLRSSTETESREHIYVDSVQEAVEFLKGTEGNILVTTGSKELKYFTELADYQERVFARVLSLPNVAAECDALGFHGKNLICMQGPFSRELNLAMIRQIGASWLVSKDTGKAGGFPEKWEAASEAGIRMVIIGRPLQEEGVDLLECKRLLQKTLKIPSRQKVTLVGIGMGTTDTMTVAAEEVCRQADLIIGASRMLEHTVLPGQKFYAAYKPEEICGYMEAHPECENVAVVFSGDLGFYSGAKKLEQLLPETCEIIAGIASPVYFCAKLKTPWEDAVLASSHGRVCNLVNLICRHPKVFSLIGSRTGIRDLCRKLMDYEMNQVKVHIGERLSYADEKISLGLPADFADYETDGLSVVLLENPDWNPVITHGLPDEIFLRDKAPMTKEEVRAVSISKLRLTKDAVVYDVGAGSGSVAIEAALQAENGVVYAIEKKEEAVALLHRNKKKLRADNMQIIAGLAPEALQPLPAPTHAFIGGSSGNLGEIVDLLLEKNPEIRIVLNAITLETVSEALQVIQSRAVSDVDIVAVTAAKSKEIGKYHMMMGQNPVYVISFEGSKVS